jgi:hypothetical protein
MAGIISQGALSPSQISAPGLYVQILPPPNFVQGVATNIGGLGGSATWGPTNQPLLCGSPNDVLRNFGPVASTSATPPATTDALNNPFDLASASLLAFSQASGGAGLGLWCYRGVDGVDVTVSSAASMPTTGQFPAAYQVDEVLDSTNNPFGTCTSARFALHLINDASAALGGYIVALYYGTLGNGLTFTIQASTKGSTYVNFIISAPAGVGLQSETFPNLPKTAAFWVALKAALNSGISGVRGPSQLCRFILPADTATGVGFTPGTNSTAAPVVAAAVSLAGGVDGTGTLGTYATAASLAGQLLGSNTSPATGIFTLSGLNPPIAAFTVAGFGDNLYGDFTSLSTFMGFADSNAAIFVSGLPLADDTATATGTALITTNAIDDFELVYVKDHVYFNDGVHVSRLMPPAPAALGSICASPPQNSLLNTTVKGTSGTYRTSSQGQPSPYSTAEIGQCQTGRILLITQPIPGANALGYATGVNASSTPVTSPIEYGTLTNFLVKSLSAAFGIWIGKNQGPTDPDPTRQGVFSMLANFLQLQQNGGVIAAFGVQCDSKNNTPTSVAQHYLYAAVMAKYYASVWWFLLSFTGGTTVNVSISQGSST